MRHFRAVQVLVLVAVATLIASCGSSDSGDKKTAGATDGAGARATHLAVEDTPFHSQLEEAGYKIVDARRFPAELAGRNTMAVTYRSRKKHDVGGVVYASRRGNVDRVVWHWHFERGAPDSVSALELNDDGLWDVRVHMRKGQVRDYIQHEDFSFFAPGRDDFVAMNGPASASDGLWHAFDGDTTSVWRSTASGGGAWIDVAAPLGVADGVLTVQLGTTEQPAQCEILADGNRVQEIELDGSTSKQVFSLKESVRGARTVRVVFKAPRGGGDAISVSELGLK